MCKERTIMRVYVNPDFLKINLRNCSPRRKYYAVIGWKKKNLEIGKILQSSKYVKQSKLGNCKMMKAMWGWRLDILKLSFTGMFASTFFATSCSRVTGRSGSRCLAIFPFKQMELNWCWDSERQLDMCFKTWVRW